MLTRMDLRKESIEKLFAKLDGRNNVDLREDIEKTVEEIIKGVKTRGDEAVLQYTQKYDGAKLTVKSMSVSKEEIEAAYQQVDEKLVGVIRRAKANIEAFHIKQMERSWFTTEQEGVLLGQKITPLERVGVYVPAGTAPLPSSVLMNVLPAKVAGVKTIIMTTPMARDGSVNPAILVAAQEAGVDEIYKIGGAQAIAALALGTATVPKVDKIVGPGNIYVATAKKKVFGYCDIDMIAGPSEIAIIADESASAEFIAADLLSQAEHDVLASSVLITVSQKLADAVQIEVEKQLAVLERKEIAKKSLEDYGVIVIANNMEEAITIVNRMAPEHLELCVSEAFSLLGSIQNAGAIFLGNYAPEPLGDYFAGPNHVLPTNGTARFFSPLNVSDFLKKTSVISYSRMALQRVKEDVVTFAEAEGLTAHANAIKIRFKEVIP